MLGIGGGVVMVPVMVGMLRIPLKRALGTSLVIIAFMVIPGTFVHTLLGHINWAIVLWLTLGVVPGATDSRYSLIPARPPSMNTFKLAVSKVMATCTQRPEVLGELRRSAGRRTRPRDGSYQRGAVEPREIRRQVHRRDLVVGRAPQGEPLHVGYGQDDKFWRDFVSALRIAGYDGVLSIEHEDGLVSVDEGLAKAVDVLQRVLLRDQPGEMWWA